jgi:hypothetical protein
LRTGKQWNEAQLLKRAGISSTRITFTPYNGGRRSSTVWPIEGRFELTEQKIRRKIDRFAAPEADDGVGRFIRRTF